MKNYVEALQIAHASSEGHRSNSDISRVAWDRRSMQLTETLMPELLRAKAELEPLGVALDVIEPKTRNGHWPFPSIEFSIARSDGTGMVAFQVVVTNGWFMQRRVTKPWAWDGIPGFPGGDMLTAQDAERIISFAIEAHALSP